MDYYLEPQLKNADQIKTILKEVDASFTLNDGSEVETLLVYLPIEKGKTAYDKFFSIIKDSLLVNFVFSIGEIEKKVGVKSEEAADKLFKKAIRKLSQHTAQGELGELILFTLLDAYIGAPKILSKISLKTSRRMPVYGADAVHCQFYDGKLKIFLGESKLFKDFKGAVSKAVSSIVTAKEKYEEEFDLMDSHIDFPNMDERSEEALLKLLDPFSDENFLEVVNSPCFIGFSSPDLISGSKNKEDFIEEYSNLACEYIEHFFQKVKNKKIDIEKVSLLMLPFSCVDELVDSFIKYLGIEK